MAAARATAFQIVAAGDPARTEGRIIQIPRQLEPTKPTKPRMTRSCSRLPMRAVLETRKPSAGSRIIASLREAVDWEEGKDVPVRVTTVDVPTIGVRATRKRLGLSQAGFAANFGFQPATLRN